jgi:hypothetical protein
MNLPFAGGLLIALFWIVAELVLGALVGGPAGTA